MTLGSAATSLIEKVRSDRKHGASELARQCLKGIANCARDTDVNDAKILRDNLIQLAQALQQARPTMAPIMNLVERWRMAFKKTGAGQLDETRAQAVICAQALIAESEQAAEGAAAHTAELIGPDKIIITHSLSSTVVRVFEILGAHAKAIITESRPPGEGRRLAEKLSELGIATDFISDQQMGLFVQRANAALVGADAIAADGSVINKAGTYLLALAARDRGVPFYVCFESFKCSKFAAADIPLEHHNAREYAPPELRNVTPHNVYFDITPAHLVTAWITETGVQRKFSAKTA
ncbi:MAG: translation initiation factor eIF-2B [Acidiferrobacterales bacterium]|nr:translation initiation factor eIF-2B [Acidiferrobacterales bacterium]